ncbi:MAG: hydrogenase nickel incorporation protein HypB [Candidatus Melainabacteria bacterium]|nr:hydrogenase nickel incorporation protein HypB [Candidatus Melainabacteria bacterium]
MHDTTDQHLFERVLQDNDQLADENRHHFDDMGAYVVNFMSAPGAGKTTLILELAKRLKDKLSVSVIEGDMVGDLDAERLRTAGVSAFQISTGRSCHLDAAMIARLLHATPHPEGQMIIIENVGNLVCPAEFPLGEHLRIVLLSVTEGDDKPIKYPVIFHNCDAVVLTKTDLIDHVDFNFETVEKTVKALNPKVELFKVSTKNGDGLDEFLAWLEARHSITLTASAV